ncbi:hypothetical protein ACWGLF_01920 [Streptomyces puniciscabiei]
MIEYGGSVCAVAVPRIAVARAVPRWVYETVRTVPGAGVYPLSESAAQSAGVQVARQ